MKNASEIIADISAMIGEDKVVVAPEVLARQSVDYVGYRNWERFNKKFLAPRSLCIAKAGNVESVAKLLSYCNRNQIVVIPKTGNSSATAAIEAAHERTIVLDGSAMNQILEFNSENMLVTVQCGVPLETLENYLNKQGYTTGHFPQSLPMAQMGGLTATRSTGQFSTLYGGIEDLVVGLEAVLPDGKVIRIKNVPRRAAGPDIRHLFIGNEGALAYITEVTLKIFQYQPENRWLGAFSVPDMQCGLKALREVMAAGYKPAVVRLHDAYQAELDYAEFVKPGECIFICITEGPAEIAQATGVAVQNAFLKLGSTALGDKPVQVWLEKRNNLCWELDDNHLLRAGVMAETCEISALWSEIGKIYEHVLARVPKEIEDLVYICGHSSHSYVQGTNIYFKFGIKGKKDAALDQQAYYKLLGIIMEETLKFGGSIAHHHGIGKYRARWMEKEHGSSYPVLLALKTSFDPNGIMNKGTLFSA